MKSVVEVVVSLALKVSRRSKESSVQGERLREGKTESEVEAP